MQQNNRISEDVLYFYYHNVYGRFMEKNEH